MAMDRGRPVAHDGTVAERVVVGVDTSPASLDALAWAIRYAIDRSAQLDVVLAFDWLDQVHLDGGGFDPSYTREDAARVLDGLVDRTAADLGTTRADLAVTSHVVVARPAKVLLDAAADADLVVVGSRGLGGFRGLLLGSVSAQVVAHAPCPVVVHRPRSTLDAEPA